MNKKLLAAKVMCEFAGNTLKPCYNLKLSLNTVTGKGRSLAAYKQLEPFLCALPVSLDTSFETIAKTLRLKVP